MSSRTAWPLCELEASSTNLAGAVTARLAWWVDHPAEHARFLNTLSLMEHIGSRKIMVSQTGTTLGRETLKHLAEETRHAFFFKKAAETLAGRGLEYDEAETIRPASAKMYFGRLDAGIAAELGPDTHPEVPYLYVSLIIELRAIWTYRLYHDVLQGRPSGMSLKSVLAEEELHLEHMLQRLGELDPELPARVPLFTRLEDRLFRTLWAALESPYAVVSQAA